MRGGLLAPPPPKLPGFFIDHRGARAGVANPNQCGQLSHMARADTDRLQFVPSPRRTSRLSLRIEVQQFDIKEETRERTQLSPINTPRFYISDGEEVWMTESWWIDSSFPASDAESWTALLDCFPNTPTLSQNGGQVNISNEIILNSGVQKFRTHLNGGVSTNLGASYPTSKAVDVAVAKKGVWHDFLRRVVMSKTSSGLIEVWHSETSTEDARGILPTFTTEPQGKITGFATTCTCNGIDLVAYPEYGQYRHTNATPGIVFFGGAAVQSTRQMAEALWTR